MTQAIGDLSARSCNSPGITDLSEVVRFTPTPVLKLRPSGSMLENFVCVGPSSHRGSTSFLSYVVAILGRGAGRCRLLLPNRSQD